MEIILAWVSIGLGVADLAYGFYQNRLKQRIERLARLQAWEIYQSAYQAVGWFNDAYNETDASNKEIILFKAHALSDSHYFKTIHNIYTHHSKITPELIDTWVSQGSIKEHAKNDFLRQNGESVA